MSALIFHPFKGMGDGRGPHGQKRKYFWGGPSLWG